MTANHPMKMSPSMARKEEIEPGERQHSAHL
jgi:hypothetical protein